MNDDKFIKYIAPKIKSLMDVLSKKISEIDDIVTQRKRKIGFADILYLQIQRIGNSFSTDLANQELMKINPKFDVSKAAIIKKKNKIDNKLFDELNDTLLAEIYSNIKGPRYLAVDGTHCAADYLLNEDMRLGVNKLYCTTLISLLYDTTTGVPLHMNICSDKTRNERTLFYEQEKYLEKGDVLIADRGYYSKGFLSFAQEKKVKVICRLKANSNYVKLLGKKEETIVTETINGKQVKIRIINYTIDNEPYYLLTTVMNRSIKFIQNKYHKRWDIETFIKHAKYNLSMKALTAKSINTVKQDIAIHTFISLITSYIEYLLKECVKKGYKINKKGSTNTVVNNICSLMIYNKSTDDVIDKIKHYFNVILKALVKVVYDRHHKRISVKPQSKFYFRERVVK